MQLHCPSCGCAYAADQADGLCPRCLAAMAVRTSDTPVEESPFEEGETFHGLKVQKLVARGGMGIVYRARQPVSNRDVALKILPRALAVEKEFRLRFDREARALAGLSHPNIVNLYDYGVDGDLMFLVMEFVEGVSLREEIREKKMSPGRALKIALDLCEALQFAHREGIIHRDIKPENVLIDRTGRVKLTDFGLAKRIDAETTQLTQTNFAIGTPHYMAPEQLEQPKTTDHRVDVYSMGVLLYEMLTRELPIGRFPAPSSKEGVDERLDSIVYRCLEKNPDDRYQTVAELKTALESATGKTYESARIALADDRPAPTPRPKVASNHEVNCPCGWQFYVPAGARGTVHCPSCGEPLRLMVATPPPPRPAAAPAAEPEPADVEPRLQARVLVPKKLLVAGGALSALIIVCLFLVLGLSRRDPPPQEISSNPGPKVRLPEPAPVRTTLDPMFQLNEPARTTPPGEPPRKTAGKPAMTVAQLRVQLDATVAQSNMAGLVATILLNSGRADDHEQLQGRLRHLDGDIHELLLRLEEQGLRRDAPERFRSGDRLTSFSGRRLEPARTLAFADNLRSWLRAFQPGIAANIMVTRNRVPVTFEILFIERTPELVALAHQAGVVLGETPGVQPEAGDVKAVTLAPIPVATLKEFKDRLAALPPFYRTVIPYEERGRADALLLAGQGSREDTLFLTGRYGDLLRRCETEQKSFVSKLKELEAKMVDPTSVTDTVVCKDRKIEGTILEETEEYVKIKARFGAVTINRGEILRIEKGKGAAAEFKTAYEAARGQKTELIKLLGTAKERKLPLQTELAAVAILAVDPGDERARIEAGVGKTPFATIAAEPDPALSAEKVEYRGKMYTMEQLRQELRSLGYVLVNGLWCEKIPKVFKIDNLYRDAGPATFNGAQILSQTHTEKDTVYDIKTKSFVPRTKLVSVARYIGNGGCTITIDSPGDIIDARVRARSQVSRIGGSVQVSVAGDPRDVVGKVLYTLAAPGENDSSYDVTDKVAGARTITIRADVKGDGMFLVSDSNDLGVLEVKYTYGKPLDRVNALFSRRDPSELPTDFKVNNESIESGCRSFAGIAAQNNSIADALTEMRNSTEGVVYSRDFVLPARFADIGAQIKDPLAPDWNSMTRDQALRLGQWWGVQPIEERRDFLTSYGVWCARARYLRASK